MRTLPELLAAATGLACEGDSRCTFCAAPALAPYALPDSFTARDTLAAPGSGRICAGCLLCLQEIGTATYPDGSRYAFTKAFRRMCSHVVTASAVVMATKAHADYLRGACSDPPAPPFGISLAVSGQKHVLYRGVVCHSRDYVVVSLEGERVGYTPAALRDRLALCGRLAAATGKPALAEPPSASFWSRVCDRYDHGEDYCSEWERVREEPLSRLASFLCPAKEVSDREYPSDRQDGVPHAGGGPHRPEPQADRRGRDEKRPPRGGATLFGDV